MSRRKTIAQHAVDVLTENDLQSVMFGDAGLLDEIFRRAHMVIRSSRYVVADHPLERWRRVLNALDRSNLFKKTFARTNHGLVRVFTIRPHNEE